MKRKARDPKTGKTYLVPASMTYKEWYGKYVAGKLEVENENAQVLQNGSKVDVDAPRTGMASASQAETSDSEGGLKRKVGHNLDAFSLITIKVPLVFSESCFQIWKKIL